MPANSTNPTKTNKDTKSKMKTILHFATIALLSLNVACIEESKNTPKTAGGSVTKKTVTVATDAEGWTSEQRNIKFKYENDNKVGAIKHLYVISPFSGQVILYSTVVGKVTSGSKRLTPNTVATADGQYTSGEFSGLRVNIAGQTYRTQEVLQDDGTYGSSCEYIYWKDVRGQFHQHFFTGGQIIHVADQPIATKEIILNLEAK